MTWILKHPTLLLALSVLLLLLGAAGLVAWFIVKPTRISVPDAVPSEFPETGFSHESFEGLLGRFVGQTGEVDYAGWSADAEALKSLDLYMGAIARYSPTSTPERFPEEADRLAYWLYAYNACVIKGVLVNWPLESVREVKAPLDLVAGLGFFGKLRFTLGGEVMSLYTLENGVIRKQFTDPRVHFVLNCASDGCPVLRPELPTGDALEPHLAKAAAEFVANPQNVLIDHEAKRLRISQIFEWYQADFIAELTRRGLPTAERTLAAYVRLVADPARRAELEAAKGYATEFIAYDWGINAQQ